MNYYFSGIGGIGMSSLALYTKNSGLNVLGSNNENNERTEYLNQKGIKINIGHENDLNNIDLLIKSTAIREDNPEILKAKKQNIPVKYRMEYLNEILNENFSIGITGTDGKTTTTGMLSHIFVCSNKNPTVFLGGLHESLEDGNFRFGSNTIISEIDESDGFIKNTKTNVSLITNLRPDHLEHYNNDFENLKLSFKSYIRNIKDIAYINIDDNNLKEYYKKDMKTLSYLTEADFHIKNRYYNKNYQQFELFSKNTFIGEITLNVPGEIYALDALYAIAISLDYGIEFKKIQESLKSFKPVGRRFNILFCNTKKFVIDDYAHTPEEIYQTIKATKEYFPDKKIMAIFQPHRYTRLYREFNGFVNSLKIADMVNVFRIYSAFEEAIDGIDERKICLNLNEHNIDAKYFENSKNLIENLINYDDTVFLFLGAGDITEVAKEYSEILENIYVTK